MDPMNDFERDLISAMRVEPSVEFAPRVRARIASEPASGQWRVPRLALVTGGLALSALAVNLMFVLPRSIVPDSAVLPHRSLALIVPLRTTMPSIAPRIDFPRGTHVEPSDVFVSPSEMLALQRLFSGAIVAPPAAPVSDELLIPELAIDEISWPTILEGDQQ